MPVPEEDIPPAHGILHPWPTTCRSFEVIETFLIGQWVSQFPDVAVEVDEVIDAGDTVVMIGTARGRGRGSGVEVGLRFSHLWRLREGKVFEVHDVAAEPRRSGWAGDDPS